MNVRAEQYRQPFGTNAAHMKHHDSGDGDFDDELPANVSSHIEHLSRKWAEDEERHPRQQRHVLTRRRIEDWREEQALRRQFEDDLEID